VRFWPARLLTSDLTNENIQVRQKPPEETHPTTLTSPPTSSHANARLSATMLSYSLPPETTLQQ
jgi:hypothetical protein